MHSFDRISRRELLIRVGRKMREDDCSVVGEFADAKHGNRGHQRYGTILVLLGGWGPALRKQMAFSPSELSDGDDMLMITASRRAGVILLSYAPLEALQASRPSSVRTQNT